MDPRGYRIGERIGGSEAPSYPRTDVHVAEHDQFPHRLVLKTWKDLPYRFDRAYKRRGRAMIALEHPHVGRLLDFGWLTPEIPYVATELVEGSRLGDVPGLQEWTWRSRLDLLVQVAVGLEAMHRVKVPHGNLQPRKIVVTRKLRGSDPYRGHGEIVAKILDVLGPPPMLPMLGPELFASETMKRRCSYIAPEQVRGQPSDARTDIFTLGVIAYEVACGAGPFPYDGHENPLAFLARRLTETPPPAATAATHGRDCPPALEAVLLKALQLDPARRHRTAAELASALAAAA